MSHHSPRVSIALCTFNGERYLVEQLASIATQTQPVDEIILCDDGSNDSTLSIAYNFQTQGLPLHIHVNTGQLGFSNNFAKAISFCTGDIIFLCDQDDIWHEAKVAITVAHFQQNPDTLLVFSNAKLVTQDASPLGNTLWDSLPTPPPLHPGFRELLNHHWVTGAGCAFRASLAQHALPIPAGWVHDAWLAIIAAAMGEVSAIPETLFAYRQHANNQIGARKAGFSQKLRKAFTLVTTPHTETAEKYLPLQSRLPAKHNAQKDIAAKIGHLQNRQPTSNSCFTALTGIIRETLNGRYFRYAYGWNSIFRDLILLGWQTIHRNPRPCGTK